MRPFRLTRRYYSEYSVKDLTALLQTEIGEEWNLYQLAKKENDTFTFTPSIGTQIFRYGFLPVVDIDLQETREKPLVTITCRLSLAREIVCYIHLSTIILLLIAMLVSGALFVEMLTIALILFCFFAILSGDFLLGSVRRRKMFIKELKLTAVK